MQLMAIPSEQLDRLCNEALSILEIEEAKLLAWGFVNVWTDLQAKMPEFLAKLSGSTGDLWQEAQTAGVSEHTVLQNLEERHLVLQDPRRRLYRSRFAEAVRLLFLLRQRFSVLDWQTAPHLVSDVRIHLQRRRYPRREASITAEMVESLRELRVTSDRIEAVETLLQNPSSGNLALARFQKDAIVQQFQTMHERVDRALVIGAGTGAGKTKAFYIPALAEVASTIAQNNHTMAVLAIYPRVELLKDQFAEAYTESRKLDILLQHRQKRSIVIGAYYGDTPQSAQGLLSYGWTGWKATQGNDGWICPFVTCPSCQGKEMVWRRSDVEKESACNHQREYGRFVRLVCQVCQEEIPGGLLALTREHMVAQPPDILFTTTEMLNRRLSRPSEHKLFGIGSINPPRLVLLDEVHTYEGYTGAQVSYLIRRWRHARGNPTGQSLCIVGLSATLVDAEEFFSKLTGIPLHHTSYIFARDEDLVSEGMEYNLVLKGDPASGASLLSTSVQAVMLLGRMLDPLRVGPQADVSRQTYGQKIFAFTDKLDVINRWFHIEQDAETRQVLARFRQLPPQLNSAERNRRNSEGQDWSACALIGHNLNSPLRIALTSSQYRGVDPSAELVIATSTLEVGYNDRQVGAVVQHKAPRSLASFIQRKGRAGRTNTIRPWTLVIASAYGRDRWAFQHAENLFDPVLRPTSLPIENTYVQHIQATYALMDWIAQILNRQGRPVDVWDLLSSGTKQRDASYRSTRVMVGTILNDVLNGRRLEELTIFLTRALELDDQISCLPLLWNEPRPLLLEVIPTILRQIETDWQAVDGIDVKPWADFTASSPLPNYVPSSLFADLNSPEIVLQISSNRASTNPSESNVREELMPLAQALGEFAPGNVTKRFARPYVQDEAHWLRLPDEAQLTRNVLSLQHLQIECDPLLPAIATNDGITVQVFRPRAYMIEDMPRNVKSTSSSFLIWRSHFLPQSMSHDRDSIGIDPRNNTPGVVLKLADGSPWQKIFRTIRAYRQENSDSVELTRMAIGVDVSTRYEGQPEVRRHLMFEESDAPAALGFRLLVDALQFQFEPFNLQSCLSRSDWPQLYRHLGPEYFSYRLRSDVRLSGLSSFEIDWLWQLEMSMLVAVSIATRCTLRDAASEVQQSRAVLSTRALDVIFQSLQTNEDSDEADQHGRLYDRLMARMSEPAVQDTLHDHVSVLWTPNDPGLAQWLPLCYASSLGATLYEAVTRLVPDTDPTDLNLDIDVATDTIWLSEGTAGGIGLVSRIADSIALRPREFDSQMLDTLQYCAREHLGLQLRSISGLIARSVPDLVQALAEVREASELRQQTQTRHHLVRVLENHGLAATRELVVALNAKLLRPNSGPDSDRLVALLVDYWEQEEQRIGCAIDLRVMAVAALRIDEIRQQVTAVLSRLASSDMPENQIFNLLQSLLWLTCEDSCPDCIEHHSVFQLVERPSRSLLRSLVLPTIPYVEYGSEGWQDQISANLLERYSAQLRCEQDQLENCKHDLLDLLTVPMEFGYQLFYPTIECINQNGHQWVIDLIIREMTQR